VSGSSHGFLARCRRAQRPQGLRTAGHRGMNAPIVLAHACAIVGATGSLRGTRDGDIQRSP